MQHQISQQQLPVSTQMNIQGVQMQHGHSTPQMQFQQGAMMQNHPMRLCRANSYLGTAAHPSR